MKTKTPTFKILHAESDPELAALVAGLLKRPRYKVFRAATGAQALSVAAELRPKLAILAVRLPEVSGYELCRRLREKPGLESLPIVVLSPRRRGKVKSFNAGADAFLGKASAAAELPATVAALLRRAGTAPGALVRKDVRLDWRRHAVFLGGALEARLSRDEFLFLHELVRKSPAVVSPAELKEGVLAHFRGGYRSLEKLVTRTRRRLGRPLGGRVRGTGRFGWLFAARGGPS